MLHGFVILRNQTPIDILEFEVEHGFWSGVTVLGYAASLSSQSCLGTQTGHRHIQRPGVFSYLMISNITSMKWRSDSSYRSGYVFLPDAVVDIVWALTQLETGGSLAFGYDHKKLNMLLPGHLISTGPYGKRRLFHIDRGILALTIETVISWQLHLPGGPVQASAIGINLYLVPATRKITNRTNNLPWGLRYTSLTRPATHLRIT